MALFRSDKRSIGRWPTILRHGHEWELVIFMEKGGSDQAGKCFFTPARLVGQGCLELWWVPPASNSLGTSGPKSFPRSQASTNLKISHTGCQTEQASPTTIWSSQPFPVFWTKPPRGASGANKGGRSGRISVRRGPPNPGAGVQKKKIFPRCATFCFEGVPRG